MSVVVIEIPHFQSEKDQIPAYIAERLNSTLHKVSGCESTMHLPSGQTEVYENHEIVLNGVTYPLCTIRINKTHRLFYITAGKDAFIPLEVVLFHDIASAKILKPSDALLIALAAQIAIEMEKHTAPQDIVAVPSFTSNQRNVKGAIVFDADQEMVLEKAFHERGMLLFGAGGTGKTEVAIELLRRFRVGTYVTESAILCAAVNAKLGDVPRDMIQVVDYFSLENQVCAIVAPELITSKIPANEQSYFFQWYSNHLRTELKAQRIKGISPRELYVEMTRVIFQFDEELEAAYLSKEHYLSLHDLQSCFSCEQRSFVYAVFLSYKNSLENDPQFYEPHLRSFDILKAMIAYKNQFQGVSSPLDLCSMLTFLGDEIQLFHPFKLRILFELLIDPEKGNWILLGDMHQAISAYGPCAENQLMRVLQSMGIKQSMMNVVHLEKDYRNGVLIGGLGNLMLAAENTAWGSVSRFSAYGVDVSAATSTGELSVQPYSDVFAQSVRDNLNIAIIVPDDADIAAMQALFGGNVLPISCAGGLEWGRVVLVDFGRSESAVEWCRVLESLVLSDISTAFSRKKGMDAGNTPSVSALILHQKLNLGLMRACNRTDIVDSNTPFLALFQKLIDFITATYGAVVPAASDVASVESVLVASTPEAWIATAKRFIEHGAFESAAGVVWSDRVFATPEDAALLKAVLQDAFKETISQYMIQCVEWILQKSSRQKLFAVMRACHEGRIPVDAVGGIHEKMIAALKNQDAKKLQSVVDSVFSKWLTQKVVESAPAPTATPVPISPSLFNAPVASLVSLSEPGNKPKKPAQILQETLLTTDRFEAEMNKFLCLKINPEAFIYCLLKPGFLKNGKPLSVFVRLGCEASISKISERIFITCLKKLLKMPEIASEKNRAHFYTVFPEGYNGLYEGISAIYWFFHPMAIKVVTLESHDEKNGAIESGHTLEKILYLRGLIEALPDAMLTAKVLTPNNSIQDTPFSILDNLSFFNQKNGENAVCLSHLAFSYCVQDGLASKIKAEQLFQVFGESCRIFPADHLVKSELGWNVLMHIAKVDRANLVLLTRFFLSYIAENVLSEKIITLLRMFFSGQFDFSVVSKEDVRRILPKLLSVESDTQARWKKRALIEKLSAQPHLSDLFPPQSEAKMLSPRLFSPVDLNEPFLGEGLSTDAQESYIMGLSY